MKHLKAIGAALTITLATVMFITTAPSDAHDVRGCAIRQTTGSYNYTWASDTYADHSSPTNCEVQARLTRRRNGGATYKYGSWGIIRSYIYSNADSVWYGSARNCARIKVPSTGYRSNWSCIN